MIEARQLTYTIRGRNLVENVSFTLQHGELLAVVGPNGAGKSTLLKLLTGELRPSRGAVLLKGRPLSHWPLRQRARMRAVLPQSTVLTFPFTALEVALIGRTAHNNGIESENDMAIAMAALERVGVTALTERTYTTLSGGEQQRVQLARVLTQIWEAPDDGGRCLLLDEPTTSLDLAHQHNTLRIAREFSRAGTAVLAILHDLNLAAQYADRILMLCDGRLVQIGTPTDVLTGINIQAVFKTAAVVMPHPQHDCPLVVTTPFEEVGSRR